MITTTNSISNYVDFQPLIASMKAHNDQLPKTELPTSEMGTIQSNAHSLPKVVTYNAQGILNGSNPNTLIAYA